MLIGIFTNHTTTSGHTKFAPKVDELRDETEIFVYQFAIRIIEKGHCKLQGNGG